MLLKVKEFKVLKSVFRVPEVLLGLHMVFLFAGTLLKK